MTNEEIAERFEQLSQLMFIRGEDFFRTRAYRDAAEVVRDLPTPLRDIYRRGGVKALMELPRIGKAISGKIVEMLETETFAAWEKLVSEMPFSALELLTVKGVNLKIARELYTRFQIGSREDLRLFAEGGGLRLVDGIGERTHANILRSLGLEMLND